MNPSPADSLPKKSADLKIRHLSFGWWSLLLFLSLGIVLEALHGIKVRWYLDVSNETRRLLLTLAHAHGVLLALIHLAFSSLLGRGVFDARRWPRIASPSLLGASILLPGGFLGGAVTFYGGDPGVGILLVPVGALLLFGSVFTIALGVHRDRTRLGAENREVESELGDDERIS